MKNVLQLLICLCWLPFSHTFAQTKDSGYKIQLKVNGLKEKDTCFLANYYGDKQYLKDTALVDSKGLLTFSDKKALETGIYMAYMPNTKAKYFEMVITTNDQNFSLSTDTTDFVENMKITNTQENAAFYEYLKYVAIKGKEVEKLKPQIKKDSVNITKQLIEIDKAVTDYRKQFIDKYKNYFIAKVFTATDEINVPDAPLLPSGAKDSTFPYKYYKSHFFDNVDFTEDGILRTPIFHSKLDKFFNKVIPQMPDSIILEADRVIAKAINNKELFKYCVWYITNNAEKGKIMGMDAVYIHMYKKYYLSGKAYWADSAMLKKIDEMVKTVDPLLIGKKIPNAYLADSLGTYKLLWDVKAKYTVVFFYDPNCGHCQKEAPKLYEFFQKNKGKVQVYAASIERKEPEWKQFIVKNKYTDWVNVWDKHTHTDFRKMYDVYSTPVIYVLDQDKKIIAKRLGAEQIDEFIKNYEKLQLELKKKGIIK